LEECAHIFSKTGGQKPPTHQLAKYQAFREKKKIKKKPVDLTPKDLTPPTHSRMKQITLDFYVSFSVLKNTEDSALFRPGHDRENGCLVTWQQIKRSLMQGGPLPVVSEVITPLIEVITPSYNFMEPFIGLTTSFITRRGPPCRKSSRLIKAEKSLGIVEEINQQHFGCLKQVPTYICCM